MFNFFRVLFIGRLYFWIDGFFFIFSDLLLVIPFYKKYFGIHCHHENNFKATYFKDVQINFINFFKIDEVLVNNYYGRLGSYAKTVNVSGAVRNRGSVTDLEKANRKNPEAVFENFGAINGEVKYYGTYIAYCQSVQNKVTAKKIIIYGGVFNGDIIADDIIIYGGTFFGKIISKNAPVIKGGNFWQCEYIYLTITNRPVKEEDSIKSLAKFTDLKIRDIKTFEGKFIDDIFPSEELVQARMDINTLLFAIKLISILLENKISLLNDEKVKKDFEGFLTELKVVSDIISEHYLADMNELNCVKYKNSAYAKFIGFFESILYQGYDYTSFLFEDDAKNIEGNSEVSKLEQFICDIVISSISVLHDRVMEVESLSPKSKSCKKLVEIEKQISSYSIDEVYSDIHKLNRETHSQFVDSLNQSFELLDEAEKVYETFLKRREQALNRKKKAQKAEKEPEKSNADNSTKLREEEVTQTVTTVVKSVKKVEVEKPATEEAAFSEFVTGIPDDEIEEVEVEDGPLALDVEAIVDDDDYSI